MLTPEAAGGLISAHFPGYAVERVEPAGHQGWGGDSDAFTVNRRDIFRFPRSLDVRESLAVEIALLPQIVPLLPLAIPRFSHIARDPEGGPPLFAGYPRIEGLQLTGARLAALAEETQARFARQIGELIRALQRVPLETARAAGVPFVQNPYAAVCAFAAEVEEWVFPLLDTEERAWVGDLFASTLADPQAFAYEPVFCHGDFSEDHILYDPETLQLTGVIDFGDCGIDDPIGHFVGPSHEYGASFCRKIIEAASVTLDRHSRLRLEFRRQCLPLYELRHGARFGQLDVIEEGRLSLREEMARTASDRGGLL